MGNVLCSLNLMKGGYLGARHPEILSMWSRSGIEARRSSFMCTATTRTGERCRQSALRGEDACRHHLKHPERRRRADAERRARAQARIDKGYPQMRVSRALATIAALDKRELHQSWKLDPRIEAATITFACEADRKACVDWVREHCAVDLTKQLPATGRKASPRMLDRCMWAAWRVLRGGDHVSKDFVKRAQYRVNAAVKDEIAWWRRWDELDGDENA